MTGSPARDLVSVIRLEEERFTDSDVRNFPELRGFAQKYALDYVGDFEYLREARLNMQTHGSLSVQQARGVLNCAKRDFKWMARLADLVMAITNSLLRQARVASNNMQAMQQLPPSVLVKADFKNRWLYSTHERAFLVHIIDTSKSWGRWYRATNEIKFSPITWCQGRFHPLVKYPSFRISDDDTEVFTQNSQHQTRVLCEVCKERWNISQLPENRN